MELSYDSSLVTMMMIIKKMYQVSYRSTPHWLASTLSRVISDRTIDTHSTSRLAWSEQARKSTLNYLPVVHVSQSILLKLKEVSVKISCRN